MQKRLRAAIDRISDDVPDLGQHLRASVRTGTMCAYQPAPHDPIDWRTEPEP